MIGQRRVLQAVVALGCLVPFSVAIPSVLHGARILKGVATPVAPDLDSHFRYLSGIFLMLGIGFASCIPAIEQKGSRFRLLGAMVVSGGLARALSWIEIGAPSVGHRLGLVMELGVTPLLMLWQWRVESRALKVH